MTVRGTTKQPTTTVFDALIEENITHTLQNGLAVIPTLVKLDRDGSVHFQIANESTSDVYIQPRTLVAMISNAQA